MIYGASLGPFVKKALPGRAFQTNVNKIIESLPIDPKESNMDAIILGPKDMNGVLGRMLEEALKKKHSDIKVIFFYQKDTEAALISGDVKKIRISKVTIEDIEEAINQTLDPNEIGQDSRVWESGDNRTYTNQTDAITELIPNEAGSVETLANLEVAAAVEPNLVVTKSIEQRVAEMGEFSDFNFFKQSFEKDGIFKELLQENTKYADLVNLLESLDQKIAHIFTDISITAELRFELVKQISVDRSAYKGLQSNIVADKVISIMGAVVKSAEATLDSRIDTIRKAMDTISTVKLVFADQSRLQEIIDSRLAVQMDLMELSKEIIEVYQAMDQGVMDLLHHFDEEPPSDIAYINELMKPVKSLFKPQNIAAISNKVIGDLQKNKVSLSIMEDKIKSLINLVFKLCEEDATIIDYQQKLINLLMTQRVEDVVIVDNIIKNALRIFVGPSDTGRTATAVIWSGIMSRRQNTLLLDLTGNSKLSQYGMESVPLEGFLKDRLERPLLCVDGNLDEQLDVIDEVVAEIKTRLNYYSHIHIILDASQTALLSRLAASALVVHYITDCTPRGTKLLKQAIEAFTEENIAQKVILIDPPIDPIRMLSELSIDPLIVKLIILPRLQYIKACSLNHTKPFESQEIVEVFEEAFR